MPTIPSDGPIPTSLWRHSSTTAFKLSSYTLPRIRTWKTSAGTPARVGGWDVGQYLGRHKLVQEHARLLCSSIADSLSHRPPTSSLATKEVRRMVILVLTIHDSGFEQS